MTALESTVSVLRTLPESKLMIIQNLARQFAQQPTIENPYKPMSRDEILAELAASSEDIKQGKVYSAEESVSLIRDKYGL